MACNKLASEFVLNFVIHASMARRVAWECSAKKIL